MDALLQHPAAQSVLLPLLVALAVAAPLRGRALAAAAVGAAAAAGALAVLGAGEWPPRTGMQKLPWLLAGMLAAGVALDLARSARGVRLAVAGALVTLAIGWLAAPQLGAARAAFLAGLAALLAGAWLVLARLASRETPATRAAATLGVGGAALAAVAFNAGSLAIAQVAAALAVGCGVYALSLPGAPTSRFAGAGVAGAGGATVLLVAVTALLTDVSPLALALLVPVYLADAAALRLWRPPAGSLRELLLVSAVAAIPALAAVAAAAWLQPADSAYYQ